jgi:hypothetical protein
MSVSTRTVVGRCEAVGGGAVVVAVSVTARPPAGTPAAVVAAMERSRVMAEVEAVGRMPADKRLKVPFASVRMTVDELRRLHDTIGQAIAVAERHTRDITADG